MLRAVKTWLSGTGATGPRLGHEGGGVLSLPSFLFGAASASGICWLAQTEGTPPSAAIVLLFIAVLNTGWLVVRLGAPAAREPFRQDGGEAVPLTEGDLADAPRRPAGPTAACPARALSDMRLPGTPSDVCPSDLAATKSADASADEHRAGRPSGEPHTEDPSPAGGSSDRLHDGCEALAGRVGLSPRECEVLELLARGRNTRYIQDALVISGSTVKSHTYRIYRKLGVHSRQDLIDEVEAVQAEDGRGKTKAGDSKVFAFRTDGQGKRDEAARPRQCAQR